MFLNAVRCFHPLYIFSHLVSVLHQVLYSQYTYHTVSRLQPSFLCQILAGISSPTNSSICCTSSYATNYLASISNSVPRPILQAPGRSKGEHLSPNTTLL